MITELQQAGLTQVEAKTYIGLVELHDAKASEISSYVNIPTSNLYAILDSLHDKGLVSTSLQNNVRRYQAANPDTLKLLFQKKVEAIKHAENDLLDTISQLKTRIIPKEKESGFRYFENIHGIKAMWMELIDSMKSDENHKLHVGNPLAYKNLEGFYNLYHEKRKELQIPTKMIFDPKAKELAKQRSSKNLEIKYQDSQSECEWGIITNKFFMQHKEKAFLIEDEKFVQTFSEMFDELWKD